MMNLRALFSRYTFPVLVAAVYIFMYLPIVMLIFFSFNNSEVAYVWGGFTLRWYRELLSSVEVWHALQNSLIVAFSAVFLSLTLGACLAYSIGKRYLNAVSLLFYGTLAAPEIVLAVGVLTLFVGLSIPLELTTLIAGHTLLGLGYAVPVICARMAELDYRLMEASYDLGATYWQTFVRVTLPLLSPALVGAGLLVFVISLDDFIIAFFCAGASSQTLPLYIFSLIRSGASPIINALSTSLLLVSALAVLLFSSLRMRRFGVMK